MSPDKVDTMIIQAICELRQTGLLSANRHALIRWLSAALLDELDKELNTYAMRVREVRETFVVAYRCLIHATHSCLFAVVRLALP